MGSPMDADSAVLPLIAMIVGALFCAGALCFWMSGREMRTKGITVQPMVTKKFRKGAGIENYYALVSFVDRYGRPHSLELKIASRAWRSMREGGTTVITYLPDQPERAVQGPRWAKSLIGFLLLFFVAVG